MQLLNTLIDMDAPDNGAVDAVVEADIIRHLVPLLSSDGNIVQEEVVQAVCKLSGKDTLKSVLVDAGALEPLLLLFMQSRLLVREKAGLALTIRGDDSIHGIFHGPLKG